MGPHITAVGNTVQCPYILEWVHNPMPSPSLFLPAFPEYAAVLPPV
jgi:hypothetical protein